ncbi:unnamed protein product [Thlaspi arvense]|uniref:Target of rapamycin complex subunit LST8 n=1 Tax=Thlaspi arvense TaxID=13288 RepID=A0AAU9SEE9_THLAR|nr:unnamed protein product [Thlaspi arvense]
MSQPSVILATASYDRTIRFWEAKTGRCHRTIHFPALPYQELGTEEDTPQQIAHKQNKPQHVNRLEISPDKLTLAAACNPYIRVFDVNYSSEPVRTFVGHSSNVMAVGFQRDCKWLYSGSEDGTVRIWDLRVPPPPEPETPPMEEYQEFAYICGEIPRPPSPPVNYERNCVRGYGNVSSVNTVVLHPNQKELISGDQNGIIRVWDLRKDSCSYELVPEPDIAIRWLSVSLDGTMLVAANDRGICYIWGMSPGKEMTSEFEPLCKLQAHDTLILKCALSPGNRYLATASSDKTVKIWNVGEDFKLEKVLTGHQRWVWDCAFSVDGEFLLTASSDATARLWSTKAGKEMKLFRGHRKAAVCCALRDD